MKTISKTELIWMTIIPLILFIFTMKMPVVYFLMCVTVFYFILIIKFWIDVMVETNEYKESKK